MKLDTKAFEDKMKKTIAVLEEEFACIRIGRASARVLDKITSPITARRRPSTAWRP